MDRPICYDCKKEFERVAGNPYVVDDTLGFEIWYLCPGCVAKRKVAGKPVRQGAPPGEAPAPSPAPTPPPPPGPDPFAKKRGWFGGGR